MAAHDPQYLFELDGNKDPEEILGVGDLHCIELQWLILQLVKRWIVLIFSSMYVHSVL